MDPTHFPPTLLFSFAGRFVFLGCETGLFLKNSVFGIVMAALSKWILTAEMPLLLLLLLLLLPCSVAPFFFASPCLVALLVVRSLPILHPLPRLRPLSPSYALQCPPVSWTPGSRKKKYIPELFCPCILCGGGVAAGFSYKGEFPLRPPVSPRTPSQTQADI